MSSHYSEHLTDEGAVPHFLTATVTKIELLSWRLPGSLISLAGVCLLASGCSGGPPPLTPPDIDPAAAADMAFELYDTNGDGLLDGEELEACPAIVGSLSTYDTDSDSVISRDELANRLQRFVKSRAALYRLSVAVFLDKKPLSGATVRFVPEPYFEDRIKPATGVTGRTGTAQMAVADEDLPENQRNIRAVQCGTYRVEITHPDIDLPPRYNTETTLGYESVISDPSVEFQLKSR